MDGETINLDWPYDCINNNTLTKDVGFGNDTTFMKDIESVLKMGDYPDEHTIFIDKGVKIEREMLFESNQDCICVLVYTDLNYNINKMFLNID